MPFKKNEHEKTNSLSRCDIGLANSSRLGWRTYIIVEASYCAGASTAARILQTQRVLGHIGGGLEYRFTPHIGIFGEIGYVFPNGAVKQQLSTDQFWPQIRLLSKNKQQQSDWRSATVLRQFFYPQIDTTSDPTQALNHPQAGIGKRTQLSLKWSSCHSSSLLTSFPPRHGAGQARIQDHHRAGVPSGWGRPHKLKRK